MTRTRLTLLALSCMLGCTRREPAEQPAPMPLPAPTHYLDETFALGSAHCRLVAAEPMLTEPAHPGEGLVADDIPVVETRFACEDARGAAIPIRSLHAELAWLDQARALHPPSSASKLAQREPSHVVFELGRGTEGLMSARSYDARTGEPVGPHALGRARLIIEASAETLASRDPSAHAPRARVVLAPWPRLHDPALDALLDRLALGLATAAPFDMLSHTEQGRAALVLVSDLYGQTVERFGSKLLRVRAIENLEGQPRLTLTLEQSRRGAVLPPDASFSFELARAEDGSPSIVRLLDPVGTQAAVECAARRADLEDRLERSAAGRRGRMQALEGAREPADTAAFCNALGTRLPGPCSRVDPEALAEALRVGASCGPSGGIELDLGETVPPPGDFEVKLRRAHAQASFERSPRYTLSVARSGRVSFEGPERVGTAGASEGRTAAPLLAALWGRLGRLGWFERAPALPPERCLGDAGADLISVRAEGRERSVRDRDGCRGELSHEELELLTRAIERVGAVDAWAAPDFPDFSRHAEIWVVAAE